MNIQSKFQPEKSKFEISKFSKMINPLTLTFNEKDIEIEYYEWNQVRKYFTTILMFCVVSNLLISSIRLTQ